MDERTVSCTPGSGSSSGHLEFASTLERYDVFISFRGEDTRYNFTSHLYKAFCQSKIKTYIDESDLPKGDEISPTLLRAIEDSKISVIIFSENYASSSWCLDELNHILRCKVRNKHTILPIFYHVDPSNVRRQKGSYADAFSTHEERFKDKMDKVQQWRNALTEVATLSGWRLSESRSEAKLVEEVVKDILKKLYHIPSSDDFKDLFGIDKRINQLKSLLDISSPNVRIVGIWGMGGIGKTTLAQVLFDKFASQFEGHYFFSNVKGEAKKYDLDKLQIKLFSELLNDENLKMVNDFVRNRLKSTKVLIVLDDVDHVEQLEHLAGGCDWFGQGSKIILTTRDMEVLNNIEDHGTYKVEELNFDDAFKLFCSKAFRGKSPPTDFLLLSGSVVDYAKGIPLALKVLGRHLCSKSIKEWESAWNKLKVSPNVEIQKVLRLSFDGLEDNEKYIFLDIVCFFKGESEIYVKRILDACGLSVDTGIRILIAKCLITIMNNKFEIHDLLRQMGREIVHEESKQEPGKRSRLWLADDIYRVLKYNKGTGRVQGISLNTSELSHDLHLNPLVFENMDSLQFLKFWTGLYGTANKLYLPQGLEFLPDALKYLRWDKYPLKSLPSNFAPENLVELDLRNSQLEHLWNGIQIFGNLKYLNLTDSKKLMHIPDLSTASNLETLYLDRCSNLDKFPELPRSIKHFSMKGTRIEQVPSHSVESLLCLETFLLDDCEHLNSFPTNLCKLKSLRWLSLSSCSKLEYFPEILEPMEHLRRIYLDGSGIRELPTSIGNLVGIETLDLSNCTNLKFVPQNIYNKCHRVLDLSGCPVLDNFGPFSKGLCYLRELNITKTSVCEIPDWLFWLPNLDILKLSGTMISGIPESIKYSKLHFLYIQDCKFLQFLPELPLSLRWVDASGCESLEMITNSSIVVTQRPQNYQYDHLEEFKFTNCLELDCKNIITEFQIRAFYMASGLILNSNDNECKINDIAPAVEICFPGYEIPEWFNIQNEGCFINVKLPNFQSYNATNFKGLVFCIVVPFENNVESNELDLLLQCEIWVQTDSDVRYLRSEWNCRSEKMPSSTHVFMWYAYKDDIDLDSAIEMSFLFSADVVDFGLVNYNVERCGVHMVCLRDAMDFGITSSELNVITNEPEPRESQIDDLDVDHEPYPKRTKLTSSPLLEQDYY